MASKELACVTKRRSQNPRAKMQQRNRRKHSIFKKAREFFLECESDIFVAIRVHKSGQIHILDSSTRNEWLRVLSHLVLGIVLPLDPAVDVHC